MTPSGIEPATFQLVAQCLNQLRHQQRAHFKRLIKSNTSLRFYGVPFELKKYGDSQL